MAAAAQKNFLKNLGCPVCLDVCTDPRMLPCPQGGHTLCKRCLDGLVRGPTITCPECRAKHNVPPSGSDGFPRNIMAAGLIDSLCKECRMAHPEVTCTHCDKMLCRSCHVAHQAFDTVKQSFGKLQVVIWKGGKDVKEAEIKRLGVAIEHDIDQAMDQLADQLEDRRKTLKAELRKIIKEHMDSIKPWRKEVDRKISEAQTYLDKANRELGDKYRDRITNQQMTDITSQSQHKIKEIKLAISKAPSPSKPVLRYNSRQAITTISSFGSIELLPVDTEDCPIAVDTGPLTLDKPRVVGKEGSDPDILDTAIASLYLMATLMGKDLWMYVQGMPHLFSVGGLFYQQIERDLGLTDGRHCELPTLPGKVFRYNGNDDRLELCVEPHGHFPIEPGIENKVLRSGLSATQDIVQ